MEHIAGDLAGPRIDPGHFSGISHRREAGESSSSNGMVPGVATREDLDVRGGVNDGGREAEEGGVGGIVDEKIVPGEGPQELEPT